MSWRSFKSHNYNRTEEKEEIHYWLQLYNSYDPYEWNDFDEFGAWGIDWWDYAGSGSVNSMDEYHQMHMLTLLRKLDVPTARTITADRGWWR